MLVLTPIVLILIALYSCVFILRMYIALCEGPGQALMLVITLRLFLSENVPIPHSPVSGIVRHVDGPSRQSWLFAGTHTLDPTPPRAPRSFSFQGSTCWYGGNERRKLLPRHPLYRLWYCLSPWDATHR